jgi:hypothetical protein
LNDIVHVNRAAFIISVYPERVLVGVISPAVGLRKPQTSISIHEHPEQAEIEMKIPPFGGIDY